MAANKRQPDLAELLARLDGLEAELAAAREETAAAHEDVAALKEMLARKEQIIEWLQRKMFGRSSERLDPNQLDLDFDDATLGLPARRASSGRSHEAGPEAKARAPARGWRRSGRTGGGRRRKKKADPPQEG